MEMSNEVSELFTALAKAQSEVDDAEKARTNPAFRSRYADLGAVVDACKPALNRHGLSFIQTFEPSERGMLGLTTMLCHASGQWVRGTAWVPLVKDDPQGYGSAATYARRYGLSALVGVCPADDDGNAATDLTARQHETSGQFRPPAPTETRNGDGAPPGVMFCKHQGCGTLLTKGQFDVSTRAFGLPLCPQHQKERAKV